MYAAGDLTHLDVIYDSRWHGMWQKSVALETGWILLVRKAECWWAASDRWEEEEPNTNTSITADHIKKSQCFCNQQNYSNTGESNWCWGKVNIPAACFILKLFFVFFCHYHCRNITSINSKWSHRAKTPSESFLLWYREDAARRAADSTFTQGNRRRNHVPLGVNI